MKTIMKGLLAAGLLAVASYSIPAGLAAQQRSGVEIWSQTCGNCHLIQPANRYTAGQWESVMVNMMILARMTDDEAEAVLDFLKGGARQVASAEPAAEPVVLARLASSDPTFTGIAVPSGAEIYAKECVACHGKAGGGDGPAAVALNPRPTDLTKGEFQRGRTDDQLAEVIAKGQKTMPGFGKRLSPEDISALVSYIRELGEKTER